MAKDIYTKEWITTNSIEIVDSYEKGVLTLRALHYQLVGRGMFNTLQHYKRVVNAMIDARWDNLVDFDAFSDHDRAVLGETRWEETDLDEQVEKAKTNIDAWMKYYFKNRWENQPYYPEVWIEKKALQGVFERPCSSRRVALAPCKGYPSLTFLHEASKRFESVVEEGKTPLILYFGDYDASGEDIPRSIEENFTRFGVPVEVRRIALMEHQVVEMKLPHAPTKTTDARAANWDGFGQVELDAVDINVLRQMCLDAIDSVFDQDLYDELESQEEEEREQYIAQIKDFVNRKSE
jgi:hypothetical protein